MEYLKEVQTIQYNGYYYNRFLEKMGSNIPAGLLKPQFKLTVKKEKLTFCKYQVTQEISHPASTMEIIGLIKME